MFLARYTKWTRPCMAFRALFGVSVNQSREYEFEKVKGVRQGGDHSIAEASVMNV